MLDKIFLDVFRTISQDIIKPFMHVTGAGDWQSVIFIIAGLYSVGIQQDKKVKK